MSMLESVTMATDGTINEGLLIKRLLDDKGATVQELARAGGVSWQAAKKWIQSPTLGAGARETATAAMSKLGLDPRSVWPALATATEHVARFDELKSLLHGFSPEQLGRIKRLLESEKGDQIRLVDFIEGIAFATRT